MDNGSEGRQYDKYNEFTMKKHIEYIYQKMDFNFSFMCNYGSKVSKGEFVLFLNDDIEIQRSTLVRKNVGTSTIKPCCNGRS